MCIFHSSSIKKTEIVSPTIWQNLHTRNIMIHKGSVKTMPDADRCVCCGEIVPEGRQVCPQCERKKYIYTIPDIPPSLNKFAGRENVWAYRADKKQWQVLCAAYCRPKPPEPIKKCVVRITYFFRTRQRHDPDNYNGKFILDGLREAGIIEDDSFSNVELQLCGAYDKENPRTEIMIKEE